MLLLLSPFSLAMLSLLLQLQVFVLLLLVLQPTGQGLLGIPSGRRLSPAGDAYQDVRRGPALRFPSLRGIAAAAAAAPPAAADRRGTYSLHQGTAAALQETLVVQQQQCRR